MSDSFIEPEVKTEEKAEVTNIKVGSKEYSQDELSQLVGLGEIAREVETKYDTKIDRVFPEYTKSTQKVKDLEKKIEALEKAPTDTLDQTDVQKAKTVLKQLGYLSIDEVKEMGFVSRDEAKQEVLNTLAARDLINDTKDVVKEWSGKGLPSAKVEDVLKYMDKNEIKNPDRAYKEMYEKEIDEWRDKKYRETKRSGMYTEASTTTGGKEPPQVKAKNTEELLAQVTEFLHKDE